MWCGVCGVSGVSGVVSVCVCMCGVGVYVWCEWCGVCGVSGVRRGYRFVFGVIGTPPTAVCNFCLLVDLPRALQQFGSAPEIPVRPPPPLLNPGSAPGCGVGMCMCGGVCGVICVMWCVWCVYIYMYMCGLVWCVWCVCVCVVYVWCV